MEPSIQIEFTDDGNCFVVFDGKRIAQRKRGKPRSSWVALEPGFEVIDGPGYIEVLCNGVGKAVRDSRGARKTGAIIARQLARRKRRREMRRFETVTFTPEMAAEALKNFGMKRPLSNKYVARYAKDMADGNWGHTGAPVIQGTDGKWMDGQHRFEACVRSKTPFTTDVVYNVDPECIWKIDQRR
jgi:hypothetical protein